MITNTIKFIVKVLKAWWPIFWVTKWYFVAILVGLFIAGKLFDYWEEKSHERNKSDE